MSGRTTVAVTGRRPGTTGMGASRSPRAWGTHGARPRCSAVCAPASPRPPPSDGLHTGRAERPGPSTPGQARYGRPVRPPGPAGDERDLERLAEVAINPTKPPGSADPRTDPCVLVAQVIDRAIRSSWRRLCSNGFSILVKLDSVVLVVGLTRTVAARGKEPTKVRANENRRRLGHEENERKRTKRACTTRIEQGRGGCDAGEGRRGRAACRAGQSGGKAIRARGGRPINEGTAGRCRGWETAETARRERVGLRALGPAPHRRRTGIRPGAVKRGEQPNLAGTLGYHILTFLHSAAPARLKGTGSPPARPARPPGPDVAARRGAVLSPERGG